MFKIPLKFANCGNDRFFAVSKEPLTAFDDETGTASDEVIGAKYGIILQNNGFQPITVKVKGKDQLPQVTNETLQAANAEGTPVLLTFDDCIVKCGAFQGKEYTSASAASVKIAAKAAAPASAGFPNPKA